MRHIVMVVLIAIILSSSVLARPITFDDLYSIPRPSDHQISPDGHIVTFVLRTTDWDTEHYERHLWLMGTDGGDQRRLELDTSNPSSPQWAPDGSKLYFQARYDGVSQVWAYWLDGDSMTVVTSLASGVREFFVDPTGKRLALVTTSWPDCNTDSCHQARSDSVAGARMQVMDYDHLMFRHYNSWDDGQASQLWILDLATGERERVGGGMRSVPTDLLGGWGDVAWVLDGQWLIYSASQTSTPALWPENDLYLSLPSVSQTPSGSSETTPRNSPDFRLFSFHLQLRKGYESDQRDLVVWDESDRCPSLADPYWKPKRRNLTKDFDRSVGGYVWDPSSEAIWFTAIDDGFNKVYRVDIQSKEVETILDDAVYSNLTISPDGSFLILTRSLSHEPYELYRYDIESKRLTQLTNFTDSITAELDLATAQDFWFEGFNGDSVHGFITYPPDFEADSTYPLVLLVHGGPQWCWLGDFNYYGWNTQLMAAQGYVVAQIDPHGSVGYGLQFKEYVSGNWGKGDFEDLMLGVDYLLGNHAYLDSTRMAALGRSYGGFMTNWICGHTDRFKCLVTIDGSYDMRSHYGTTEELWFPEWELKGTPWSNPKEYERASPGTYAANFKTPTMIIHGQKDYRVDVSEGLMMFTALQRQGIPSRLLYFPDEGHSIYKLGNLRYSYQEQLSWLASWLALDK